MYDAHCHLSTDVKELPRIETQIECNLMSTNQFDLEYVFELGKAGKNIIPCFGIHPWYSHLFKLQQNVSKKEHYKSILVRQVSDEFIAVLPEPIYLYDHLSRIEQLIAESPATCMIGEIGLDKLFKLPWSGFYGNYNLDKTVVVKDGKKLSNYQVSVKHQQDIFVEFLKLSLKFNKPASIHCVRAHGTLFDIVKSTYGDSSVPFALHSYSGSVDHAKNWLKTFKSQVYFSVSKIFNMDRSEYICLIETIPIENLLLETDYGIDVYNGEDHAADLNKVLESISAIKKIGVEQAQAALQENWIRFKSRASCTT